VGDHVWQLDETQLARVVPQETRERAVCLES
jgi:hypothetical protein